MEVATLTPAASAVPPRLLRAASDERLVARLRGGDERAFEVIYDRYHLALLSFCRHMVGTREEAEDALQQVFVSAHGGLVQDDRPVQLRPWLYAIARNRCLSHLRARRETVAIDDVAEPSTDGLAVAAQVQQRQDLQDILRDLGQLPDDQRAALVLAELEDLSHEEIAQALGVRRDKVKALVFQARETLMGLRQARDADCVEIREQLATVRGGALRRTALQRHLAICPGCSAFNDEVKRQRVALGAVMPVVPALALKHQILGAVHATSLAGTTAGTAGVVAGVGGAGAIAGTGAVSTGVLATVGSSGLVVKALVVTALVGSAGGGAVAIRQAADGPPARRTPASAPAAVAPASAARPPAAAATTPAARGGASAKGAPVPGPSAKAGGAGNGRSPGTSAAGGNGASNGSASGSTDNGRSGAVRTPARKAKVRKPAKTTVRRLGSKPKSTVAGPKSPVAVRPSPARKTPPAARRPSAAGSGKPASDPAG